MILPFGCIRTLMAATVIIMVIVDRTLGIAALANKLQVITAPVRRIKEKMKMAFMSLKDIDVSYDKKSRS